MRRLSFDGDGCQGSERRQQGERLRPGGSLCETPGRGRSGQTFVEEDALHEPERAGAHHAHRSREGDPARERRIPCVQQADHRTGDRDDDRLSDLNADVERQQRGHERRSWQPHLSQHICEAEAVNESEDERHPRTDVAPAPDQQIVCAHVDDAQGDRRLDQPRRRPEHLEDGQCEGHAVCERECADDHEQLSKAPAKEQQPDQKQDVIRTDGNMANPERNEPLRDGQQAPPAPEKCTTSSRVVSRIAWSLSSAPS